MKHLKKIAKIALLFLFGILLSTCQKENSLIVNKLPSDSSSKAEISSPQLKSASLPPDYLQDLINSINSMVENGVLSKGEGKSLIAKADNAIKSIDKGNTNAVNGQLGAFNAEVEYFVDNGTLTSEQGQSLTNVADFVVDFPDGSFTDPRDGQKYSVVLIGDQTWMAENLCATIYNDGTLIPNVTLNTTWAGLATGAYCWYNNDISNKSTYGALYNWYAVNTQKLAPIGWHVPTESEWTILMILLGGKDVAADELKETGTVHWRSPNDGATNSSLFTALPGGWRSSLGAFGSMGVLCNMWSSTEDVSYPTAWNLWFYANSSDVESGYGWKKDGYTVRCIHD